MSAASEALYGTVSRIEKEGAPRNGRELVAVMDNLDVEPGRMPSRMAPDNVKVWEVWGCRADVDSALHQDMLEQIANRMQRKGQRESRWEERIQ